MQSINPNVLSTVIPVHIPSYHPPWCIWQWGRYNKSQVLCGRMWLVSHVPSILKRERLLQPGESMREIMFLWLISNVLPSSLDVVPPPLLSSGLCLCPSGYTCNSGPALLTSMSRRGVASVCLCVHPWCQCPSLICSCILGPTYLEQVKISVPGRNEQMSTWAVLKSCAHLEISNGEVCFLVGADTCNQLSLPHSGCSCSKIVFALLCNLLWANA